MELRIDQSIVERVFNVNLEKSDNLVTVRLSENQPQNFIFPLNFPLHDLNCFSWDRIDEISKAGKASTLFALGATKKDYMKNGFVAEYQIIGFDHDDLADGSGKAPISWDMVKLYKDEITMKKGGGESCWDECDGRTYLNGDFFSNMSDELQAIVKPVWKLTANRSGEIIRSEDRVWIKSEKELWGRTFGSYDGEGHWYEFYKQEDVPWHKFNQEDEKDWQWLRSVFAGGTYRFCYVYTDGSAYYDYAGSSFGVSPGFCS